MVRGGQKLFEFLSNGALIRHENQKVRWTWVMRIPYAIDRHRMGHIIHNHRHRGGGTIVRRFGWKETLICDYNIDVSRVKCACN